MSNTSDQTTQQSKARLIVDEIGIDTETGIIGKGHSYDNGKTFVVDDTIYGRIYHADDHDKIWKGIQDQVAKVVAQANALIDPLTGPQIGILYTDKALYKPGETLILTINASKAGPVQIKAYDMGTEILSDTMMCQPGDNNYSWQLPNYDNRGYMIKVSSNVNTQFIGVNVNNHVEFAPIMGFLGDFGPNLNQDDMKNVVRDLNRFHVNYVQFYDWYDRDDTPLRIVNGQPEQNWIDFMKRPTSFNTVKSYIDLVHNYGMIAMFYNLIYGSELGIPTSNDSNLNWTNPNLTHEMFLYSDKECTTPAFENDQSFGAKLNITYMNVLNPAWENYLAGQANVVYQYLPFDGWHVDQLGYLPSETYSSDGVHLTWANDDGGYGKLLKVAKQVNPDKRLTMNNADDIGTKSVMESNTTDFLYVEPWNAVGYTLGALAAFIRKSVETYKKPVVLASYVNKNKAENDKTDGRVNDAAALLCDAMEFSNGASHLEWGEHYLANEYFPNHKLALSENSKNVLRNYADIFVSYLQILNGNWLDDNVTSSTHQLSTSFEVGKITTVNKRSDFGQIVSLINMVGITHDNWQDPAGTQIMPTVQSNIRLTIPVVGAPQNVYLINADKSPELNPVSFQQIDNLMYISIDRLDVWDLILIK
ncbi:glycoside hydrolase family 66 protein [Limosilactobacillus fermentum]|uniref:glycoside hydrolase family 66 protein n=1 Tax=Limosilactobacillus fermentum TaxID=1613 RepID=UPI0021BF7DE0|nr:glycoside hydrolase family 66 protein [Limosilactobacillus fermentum]